jgi:hypothetical protein
MKYSFDTDSGVMIYTPGFIKIDLGGQSFCVCVCVCMGGINIETCRHTDTQTER